MCPLHSIHSQGATLPLFFVLVMAERREPRRNNAMLFKGYTEKEHIISTHISLAKASFMDKTDFTGVKRNNPSTMEDPIYHMEKQQIF